MLFPRPQLQQSLTRLPLAALIPPVPEPRAQRGWCIFARAPTRRPLVDLVYVVPRMANSLRTASTFLVNNFLELV